MTIRSPGKSKKPPARNGVSWSTGELRNLKAFAKAGISAARPPNCWGELLQLYSRKRCGLEFPFAVVEDSPPARSSKRAARQRRVFEASSGRSDTHRALQPEPAARSHRNHCAQSDLRTVQHRGHGAGGHPHGRHDQQWWR